MNKFFGHLKKVCIHKFWVFYYACKCGIPFRGLIHDLSKFNPIEFFEGVKYFQGGRSPIDACKEANGWSAAWLHHKGKNKHHYEYWQDNFDKGGEALVIPKVYVLEMFCDFLAAGRAYNGKNFTIKNELEWWKRKREIAKMNPKTIETLDLYFEILTISSDEDRCFKIIKKCYKEN